MELKKFQDYIEAFLSYYSFALLVYAATLFIASHTHLFWLVFFIATPLLASWIGYLSRSYVSQRNHRYGFKLLADAMTYEIKGNHQYTLRFDTKVRAEANHLMVYPIGHKWTGDGTEGVPKLLNTNQLVLTAIQLHPKTKKPMIIPYEEPSASEGNWRYWFVALNPAAHKGDLLTISYFQELKDKKHAAKPYAGYFVLTPMQKLELNVKFPSGVLPKDITASYTKPSDTKHPYLTTGAHYDLKNQQITWVISKPKKGYYYRISWK